MKTTEPKIIYLQIGDEADINEFKEGDFEKGGITWCWERIFDNDIKYISKQSIIDLIDKEINEYDKEKEADEIYALTEIKQKIESL